MHPGEKVKQLTLVFSVSNSKLTNKIFQENERQKSVQRIGREKRIWTKAVEISVFWHFQLLVDSNHEIIIVFKSNNKDEIG